MQVTVGTFNLRNLFSQYNFKASINEILNIDGGTMNGEIKYEFGLSDTLRLRTYLGSLVKQKDKADTEKIAQRIKEMNVDVLALQEVEDLDTLYEFNRQYIDENKYKYCILVEGNDPRLIDIAVLSRLPIGAVTSWKHAVHPSDLESAVFSRDMLEVDVLSPTRSKTLFKLFNNHLKSHYVGAAIEGGVEKQKNDLRRTRQAEAVKEIVKARTRPNGAFIVLGDMNDPPNSPCLKPFTEDTELKLVNALTNPTETRPAKADTPLPENTAWTHRYKQTGTPAKYELYDHIWLSPTLAAKKTEAWVHRRMNHGGDGSDHDPVWVNLDL